MPQVDDEVFPIERDAFWHAIHGAYKRLHKEIRMKVQHNTARIRKRSLEYGSSIDEIHYKSVWYHAAARALTRDFLADTNICLMNEKIRRGLSQSNRRYDPEIVATLSSFQAWQPKQPLRLTQIFDALVTEARLGMVWEPWTIHENIEGYFKNTEPVTECADETLVFDPWMREVAAEMYLRFGQDGIIFTASHMTDRPLTKVLCRLGISAQLLGKQAFDTQSRKIERRLKKNDAEMRSYFKAVFARSSDT